MSLIGCVGGICNFLSSVSPQQKFEVMDRPVVQLSYIWQAEENTSSRHEGGPTRKIGREKRGPRLNFGSSFYMFFFLLHLSLPYVNWSSQEGCLFHLRLSFQSLNFSLFYLRKIFPSLSFSHHHSGHIFSYSNCLTFPPQEMGGPVLCEQGHGGLSGYFLLSQDDKGHWPPPLASLKPQSPYSGVHLRVSDIFCGQVQFYITLLNWHCMLQFIDLNRDKMG